MKKIPSILIGLVAFTLLIATSTSSAQVVINELLYNPAGDTDYGSEKLELKNIGTTAVNISSFVLCTSFFYSFEGDFAGITLAPGQILTVHLAFPGTNDANNLYLPNFPPVIPQIYSGTLGNVADEISVYNCNPFCDFGGLGADNRMVDYVQWGTTGVGPNEERHDVAADPTRAGGALWSAAAIFDFAPVATEGQSIAFDGSNGGGGELTLGTDYRVGPPTIGQNNGCFADADCNDNIACTDNRCMAGQCMFLPNDSLCPSNGMFCDGAEVCQAGTGCISAGSPCSVSQFCNETTDTCVGCQSNANCNDNNACTTDTCNNGNCVFTNIAGCCLSNATCLDANPCTLDVCTNFVCVHSPMTNCDPCVNAADCDDDDPCTNDTCESGTCTYSFSTSDCDDDDPCTDDDQCSDGACVGQPADNCCDSDSDCEDENECTDDSCETNRCVSIANDAACDDGDPCTNDDVCASGNCAGIAADDCCTENIGCNDNDDCTTDSCTNSRCVNTAIAGCPNSNDNESSGQGVPDNDNEGDSTETMNNSNRGGCGALGMIPAISMILGISLLRRRS